MIYSLPYILFASFLFLLILYPRETGIVSHYYIPRFSIIFVFFIFIGCRGFISTDWVNYFKVYDVAPTLLDNDFSYFIENHRWEKGFIFLTCLIKTISPNYFLYQLIMFTIDFIVLYTFSKYYIPKNSIALFFLCFFIFKGSVIETNLLRNSKSIMIFLISIRALNKKNYIVYILLNLFGSLFHSSSLIFIPLVFLINHEFSKKNLILLFIFGNIIYALQIKWLVPLLKMIFSIIGNSRMGTLIDSYQLLTGDAASYGFGFGFLERTFTYLFVMYWQKKIISDNKYLIPFINLIYIFCYVFLFFSEFSIFTQRLSILFIEGYWVIYPVLYNYLSKKNKYIFLILLLLYSILKLTAQCGMPYDQYSNFLIHKQDFNKSLSDFNKIISGLQLE